MLPFGSKRIFDKCIVTRAGNGKKVQFKQHVKSKKHGRSKEQYL